MLKILKVVPDEHTGHIAVHACVVEKTGENSEQMGPVEVHGVHPVRLYEDHAGSFDRWIDGVHRGMLARHKDRKIATAHMVALQGKILLLDEEKNGTEAQSTVVRPGADAEPSGELP